MNLRTKSHLIKFLQYSVLMHNIRVPAVFHDSLPLTWWTITCLHFSAVDLRGIANFSQYIYFYYLILELLNRNFYY